MDEAVTDAPLLGGSVGGDSFRVETATFGTVPRYSFVFTVVESRHTAIAMTSFADTCGSSRTEGRIVYIDLFENPSAEDSTVSDTGRFPAWLPDLNGRDPIPSDNRAIITFTEQDASGTMGLIAQTGWVEVTDVSENAIAVRFDVQFEEGDLAGSIAASRCPTWERSATVPHPQGDSGAAD